MAVKNFPDISPDANPSFTLENNTSSFESALNKNVQHMELPGARWRGSVAFSNRSRQEANKIKAFMTSLGGQVGRFYLTPFDAYQSGTMSGTGVVDGAVASGVSSIPTKGWEGDQDTLFEAGDYIEVNGELKMVTDDVSAPQSYIEYTGTNLMPSPFDPSGWDAVTDPDGTVSSITANNPSGSSVIGLIEQTGAGQLTINGQSNDSFPVTVGDKFYCCAIVKPAAGYSAGVRFRFADSQGFLGDTVLSSEDGSRLSGGTRETKVTALTDGYLLLEVEIEAARDDSAAYSQFILWSNDDSGVAPIGTQLYAQAIYSGKADDYPAQLLATADIPIAPPLRKALTGGESIITNEPKGKFYLGSNDQSWDINVNGVQSMGFDFIEDVN